MEKYKEIFYSGNNFICDGKYIDPSIVKNYKEHISNLLNNLNLGNLIIIRNSIPDQIVKEYRSICIKKLYKPLDQYYKLRRGIPNNTRLHIPRPESIVAARFNAFNFYPWNAESNKHFNTLNNLFLLRAEMVGINLSHFTADINSEYTARIALQFYPHNEGFFNSHRDPYDSFQIAIPTISLFEYEKDYNQGGFYVINNSKEKIYVDKLLNPGDAILFHSCIEHGVTQPILSENKNSKHNNQINGRLMLLCAVNKIVN